MTTAVCCWCAAEVRRLTDGLCDSCICQSQGTANVRVAIEASLQDSLETRINVLTQLLRAWADVPAECGAQGYALRQAALVLLAEPWP